MGGQSGRGHLQFFYLFLQKNLNG